jgi:hypothetical protein
VRQQFRDELEAFVWPVGYRWEAQVDQSQLGWAGEAAQHGDGSGAGIRLVNGKVGIESHGQALSDERVVVNDEQAGVCRQSVHRQQISSVGCAEHSGKPIRAQAVKMSRYFRRTVSVMLLRKSTGVV